MAMLSRNIQNASAKHSLAEELPCSSLDVGATMLESVFCRLIAERLIMETPFLDRRNPI